MLVLPATEPPPSSTPLLTGKGDFSAQASPGPAPGIQQTTAPDPPHPPPAPPRHTQHSQPCLFYLPRAPSELALQGPIFKFTPGSRRAHTVCEHYTVNAPSPEPSGPVGRAECHHQDPADPPPPDCSLHRSAPMTLLLIVDLRSLSLLLP